MRQIDRRVIDIISNGNNIYGAEFSTIDRRLDAL